MSKRILFFALTAFAVSMPITVLWLHSINTQDAWESTDVSNNRLTQHYTSNTEYLNGVGNYFKSLKFLLDDHGSFGPYT